MKELSKKDRIFQYLEQEGIHYITKDDLSDNSFISKIQLHNDTDILIKSVIVLELQFILDKDKISLDQVLRKHPDIMVYDLRLPAAYRGNLEATLLLIIVLSTYGFIGFIFYTYLYNLFPFLMTFNVLFMGLILSFFIWYGLTSLIPFHKLYKFKNVENYDDFLNQMVKINKNRYDFNDYERIKRFINSKWENKLIT
jgi:hypothetical protein